MAYLYFCTIYTRPVPIITDHQIINTMKYYFLFLVGILFFACDESSEQGAAGPDDGTEAPVLANAKADESLTFSWGNAANPDPSANDNQDAGPGDESQQSVAPPPDLKVIRNGTIKLESGDFQETHRVVSSVGRHFGGYISEESLDEEGQKGLYSITIRLPSRYFEDMIDGIGEQVGPFLEKKITTQDVTEEFLDLESRIKNKKMMEQRFLKLLEKTGSVEEMLRVEKEIGSVRQDIERMQGRLNYLTNKSSLSTLTVQVVAPVEEIIEVAEEDSFFSELGDAFMIGWNGLLLLFLGLATIWPLLLCLIFAALFFRFYKRKRAMAT